MARTGRFGRLPTAAPDLSAQIVSLIEQYAAAEDRNILDAWTNGGKYKGKKVKDKDIIKYYQKRRDSFDRDDPMYDQWNQDLWQLKYQVADEKVNMAYRTGKIGPRAVARHYKKWARKMPKNSSFYRNLMAAAGDFMKAAAGGSAAASRGFDYVAMQRKLNAIDKEVKGDTAYLDRLNEYARRRGYIPGDAEVTSPDVVNAFEAADLSMLLDGFIVDGQFKGWERGVTRGTGEEASGQQFSRERIDAARKAKIDAWQRQIKILKSAPSDYGSNIQGLRANIQGARQLGLYTRPGGVLDTLTHAAAQFDVFMGEETLRTEQAGLEVPDDGGWNSHTNPREGVSMLESFGPAMDKASRRIDALGGNPQTARLLETLSRAARNDPASIDPESPTYNEALAKQYQADIQFIRDIGSGTINLDVFGSAFSTGPQLLTFMQDAAVVRNGVRALDDRTAVMYFPKGVTPGQEAFGGSDTGLSYELLSLDVLPSGKRVLRSGDGRRQIWLKQNESFHSRVNGDGTVDAFYVEQEPVYGADGQTVVGMYQNVDGQDLWGVADTAHPGFYNWVGYNPHTMTGDHTVEQVDGGWRMVRTGVDEPTDDEEIGSPEVTDMFVAFEDYINSLPTNEDTTEAKSALEREDIGAVMETDAGKAATDSIAPELNTMAEQMWGGLASDELQAGKEALQREWMRRRFGSDIEYTAEDAQFVTAQGTPLPANEVANRRGDSDYSTRIKSKAVEDRNSIIEQGASRGLSVEQSLRVAERSVVDLGVQHRGSTDERMPDVFSPDFNAGGETVEQDIKELTDIFWGDETGRDTRKPSTGVGSALDDFFGRGPSDEDVTELQQQRVAKQEAAKADQKASAIATVLSDAGINDPNMAAILMNPETTQAFYEDPEPFLEITLMNVPDEQTANIYFEDIAVVFASDDPLFAKLLDAGAITETDYGKIVGAQSAWEGKKGELADMVYEMSGKSINLFTDEEQAEMRSGWVPWRTMASEMPTNADISASVTSSMKDPTVTRPSETTLGAKEENYGFVSGKLDPNIKLNSNLAKTAKVPAASTRATIDTGSVAPVSGVSVANSAISSIADVTAASPSSLNVSSAQATAAKAETQNYYSGSPGGGPIKL